MFTNARGGAVQAALAVSVLMASPNVQASHRACKEPDVDIESLKATLRLGAQHWHVSIKYDVEIEEAQPDRFDVVITFSQHGHTLRDRFGWPLEFRDVLDRPTDIDDDEIEFKQRLSAMLPLDAVNCPKKLKVHVEIIDRRTGRVVEDKAKSVKWKPRKKPQCRRGSGVRQRSCRGY